MRKFKALIMSIFKVKKAKSWSGTIRVMGEERGSVKLEKRPIPARECVNYSPL